MKYAVEFRPAVLKTLKRLPKKDLRRIKNRIGGLAENLPDPNTTKMSGNNSFHKVRSGDYRIIYKNRLVILILKVGHRKDIYKRFL